MYRFSRRKNKHGPLEHVMYSTAVVVRVLKVCAFNNHHNLGQRITIKSEVCINTNPVLLCNCRRRPN